LVRSSHNSQSPQWRSVPKAYQGGVVSSAYGLTRASSAGGRSTRASSRSLNTSLCSVPPAGTGQPDQAKRNQPADAIVRMGRLRAVYKHFGMSSAKLTLSAELEKAGYAVALLCNSSMASCHAILCPAARASKAARCTSTCLPAAST